MLLAVSRGVVCLLARTDFSSDTLERTRVTATRIKINETVPNQETRKATEGRDNRPGLIV